MATGEYPAFQPNALVVLARRYLTKDADHTPTEEPADLMRRVAHDISLPELEYGHEEAYRQEIEDKFFEVQRRLHFLPNSPTLMNAGRELQQLAACFVLPVRDDLYSIFNTVTQTALIHQSGGGTGFSFSKLRPKGDLVGSTGGVASGPVSFMQVYDAATEVIKQGGTRRGANMAIMDCTHPDIVQFVDMKLNPNVMTNFNVSVSVSDDFMQAAQQGDEWTLYNPRNGAPWGSVNAAELLRKIAKNAWATGDPGLVFIDRVNENNPNPHMGRITATNPCVTAECWVMTQDGPRQAEELVGKQFHIMDEYGVRKTDARGFYPTGKQKTYWLKTSHGYRVRLTANHRVKRIAQHTNQDIEYEYVAASQLQPGDLLPMQQHQEEWPPPAGGDRQPKRDADAVAQGKLISATAISEIHRCSSRYHLEFISQMLRRTGVATKEQPGGFAGLLLMLLPQTPIHDIQQMLLRLGVMSKVVDDGLFIDYRGMATLAKRTAEPAPNQVPTRRPDQGNAGYRKATQGNRPHEYVTEFVELEPAGIADVYDVTVDQEQAAPGIPEFDGQGFHLHNCGEQPLLDYESCTLGSINLAQLRRDAANDAEFEQALQETCRVATRFLDNVIDQNRYPIEEISMRTQDTRRIGVGVMGFADLLIMEGIRYDSEEGIARARELMRFIQSNVHQASQELAKERGEYPEYTTNIEIALEDQIPMRNTSPTTIAPTGTISVIAGVSSGIEPIFALAYERHVMDDDRLPEYDRLFLEAAQRHGIPPHDQRMQQVLETGSLQGLGFPPDMEHVFRVSHEITAEWHVRMQAAWQEFCDNAVSKTVNMPESATEEDVMNAYRMAWKTGCKGITVYRDGSKTAQVLSTAESRRRGAAAAGTDEDTGQQRDTEPGYRRRPDMLPGITHRIPTGHGTTYITVNSDDQGRPFEVFVAGGKSGGCDEAQSQAITRLATLAMRHNVDIDEIRKQLTGIVCCPTWVNGKIIGSLADAIAEALHRHTQGPNGEPAQTQRSLPKLVTALANPTNIDAVKEGTPGNKLDPRTHAMIQIAERRHMGLECPIDGCNGTMIPGEGCGICRVCGYSNCG